MNRRELLANLGALSCFALPYQAQAQYLRKKVKITDVKVMIVRGPTWDWNLFKIETDAGVRTCRIVEANGTSYQIAAGMGVPEVRQMQVTLADKTVVYGVYVSMGNPHLVIVVNDENFRAHGRGWQELGKEICFHKDFPQRINVLFFRLIRADEIEIRIFERGVGPTTSSGTGTCACSTTAIAFCGGKSPITVHAPGGTQRVDWAGLGTEMTLTGPAHLIAAGEVLLG